jgi:hypothetical protein
MPEHTPISPPPSPLVPRRFRHASDPPSCLHTSLVCLACSAPSVLTLNPGWCGISGGAARDVSLVIRRNPNFSRPNSSNHGFTWWHDIHIVVVDMTNMVRS